MRLTKEFEVAAEASAAAEVAARDETLTGLFADAKTEIVEREGNRRTLRSQYRALGREGVATFHFHVQRDGTLQFEKVCDGNVWKRLVGTVHFDARGDRTRVRIEMEGRTRTLVPEITIRLPMQQQLEEMASALRERIEAASG